MGTALPPAFFEDSAIVVAQKLIGCRLCRYLNSRWRTDIITETEAYLGAEDLASHARFGKTKRNAPMFGAPGIWYVYRCYGIHAMLNVVTNPIGHPAAVLIRSLKTIQGPGRLTKALTITTAFNQTPCHPDTHLYIQSALPSDQEPFPIQSAPRIGVAYAGAIWANKPYRFTAIFSSSTQ